MIERNPTLEQSIKVASVGWTMKRERWHRGIHSLISIPMYVGDDRPTQLRMPLDEELARRLTRKLKDTRRTRAQRLLKIKRAVHSREYENALKLSVAMDRLLDRLK